MKKRALILAIDEENHYSVIKKAVGVLKKGKIIIYPTETSYGLGANAKNRKAIKRIHAIKKQAKNKPISIIVPSLAVAKKFGKIAGKTEKLIKAFMPGPLTLVVEKRKPVAKELSREGIAFRISSNTIANDLCRGLGTAITATSANLHGEKPIYSGKKVIKEFAAKVDLIIDVGELPKRRASTLYGVQKRIILRNGPVREKEIEKVLGER